MCLHAWCVSVVVNISKMSSAKIVKPCYDMCKVVSYVMSIRSIDKFGEDEDAGVWLTRSLYILLMPGSRKLEHPASFLIAQNIHPITATTHQLLYCKCHTA